MDFDSENPSWKRQEESCCCIIGYPARVRRADAGPPALPPAWREGPISAARPRCEGKTNITEYFDRPVKRELQELATERSRATGRRVTTQELLAEALNDLSSRSTASRKSRGRRQKQKAATKDR